ncbi:nicotinamidase/pyrazinamidase [Citrobacter koseri]|nr:nicotinamidase/pyrazinamidase [Citrobacter koseri]
MTTRALLLVDLQNDFCAGGALAVPEGDSTVDVANRLIAWCKARGDAVIASQDWHPAGHGSFASQHQAQPYSQGQLDGLAQTFWPDHCVQNSDGAALHPLLRQNAIDAVFHKGENPQVDSYSAFFDNGRRQKTALDAWLRGERRTDADRDGAGDRLLREVFRAGCAATGLYGECDYRRLPWCEYSTAGQRARLYGDGGRRRHAVYAG